MTAEQLDAFGLPPSFPAFMVPEKAAQFVADTKKGMSQADLLALAEERGFRPQWQPLPHLGEGVYGLGLDVDGMQVPFMVKMRTAAGNDMQFDITDGRNRYNPCPRCGSALGMGLSTRQGMLAVRHDECGFSGPEIPNDPPSRENDQRAFEIWNALRPKSNPKKGN